MGTYHRLAVPAFVVILLTATVLLSRFHGPEIKSFEQLLVGLKLTKDPQTILNSIHAYLDFQQQGLKLEPGSAEAQSIANLYFTAGAALNERKEESRRDEIMAFYKTAVELYPAVSHGWPYFKIAEILTAQNKFDQAQESYRKVELYDFGNVALMAGYWIELLNHYQGKPVDARPIYAYYRYGDFGRPASLQPFGKAAFVNLPESLFMRAIAINPAMIQEDSGDLLAEYRKQRPDDISARFFENNMLPVLLPEDGRLQNQAIALNALQKGNLSLLPDGQVRSDFYIQTETTKSLILQFELENPFGLNGQVQAYHNAKPMGILPFQNPSQTLTVTLVPVLGRNLLTLHFLPIGKNSNPAVQLPVNTAWIRIEDLHIVLPETAS